MYKLFIETEFVSQCKCYKLSLGLWLLRLTLYRGVTTMRLRMIFAVMIMRLSLYYTVSNDVINDLRGLLIETKFVPRGKIYEWPFLLRLLRPSFYRGVNAMVTCSNQDENWKLFFHVSLSQLLKLRYKLSLNNRGTSSPSGIDGPAKNDLLLPLWLHSSVD